MLGFQNFAIALGGVLAEALARTARSAEAEAVLDELPTSVGTLYTSGYLPRPLTLLVLGRLSDARRLTTEALAWHRNRGERGAEAWDLWLLGEISARQSPHDAPTTTDLLRQALTLAADLAMRPLVAHCHLGLGKLYRRTGKREQAQEHLTVATSMYREMGMRYWLEKAEAEMQELG